MGKYDKGETRTESKNTEREDRKLKRDGERKTERTIMIKRERGESGTTRMRKR